MTDQIFNHDVSTLIDTFLFGGGSYKKTGPYKTLIYEQLKDYNNVSSVNTQNSLKYGKQNITTFIPNKQIECELGHDLRIKLTKEDSKLTYRLSDDVLNNDIPYETKRNWQFRHKPYIRLYRDIDLIEACNRIYTDSFQWKKRDERLMERSEKRERETMFRMKFVWMIFKMLQKLGTTKRFLPDIEIRFLEQEDWFEIIKWKQLPQLQHYLIYKEKHGITYFKGNKKWKPLRTSTEWLFDELHKIFPNETNLLYWCENIIPFPTKFVDDMEFLKLNEFYKHKDFYVFINKLTKEVPEWRCDVLNNMDTIRCFHTGKFFVRLTHRDRFSFSYSSKLRLLVLGIMFGSYPS